MNLVSTSFHPMRSSGFSSPVTTLVRNAIISGIALQAIANIPTVKGGPLGYLTCMTACLALYGIPTTAGVAAAVAATGGAGTALAPGIYSTLGGMCIAACSPAAIAPTP